MADPQQLELLLRHGVKAWNRWRKKNPVLRLDLSEADLDEANLNRADLSEADLTRAKLLEAIFGDTDLRDAQGLDACEHFGPSTLDHRTLAKSGPLPLAFLRG